MYDNLKKNSFLKIFSILLVLTPLFYYIFSFIVILDCTRTPLIKYLTFPVYKIYEPNRKAFCELTQLNNHKIIFFSDSTNRGSINVKTKGISEYLEQYIKKEVLSIDLGGGNADIYSDFVDQSYFIDFSNTNYAVLTLNLRIFSEKSYRFLKFYQNKQRYFSRAFYEPFNIQNFFNLNKLIFNPKINDEKILNFEKRKATINNITFELGEKINQDQSKDESYFKTYMGEVNDNHPILLSIINLNEKLNDLGIKLIVYSTPVNITEGKKEFSVNNKYLTDEQQFEKRIFNNIEVIENKLQEHSIPFLNLTFKIKKSEIFFEKWASEHINYIGRKFVAKELSKFIDNIN